MRTKELRNETTESDSYGCTRRASSQRGSSLTLGEKNHGPGRCENPPMRIEVLSLAVRPRTFAAIKKLSGSAAGVLAGKRGLRVHVLRTTFSRFRESGIGAPWSHSDLNGASSDFTERSVVQPRSTRRLPAQLGARANAGICHAACYLTHSEMRPRILNRDAARGAPAPVVAHL